MGCYDKYLTTFYPARLIPGRLQLSYMGADSPSFLTAETIRGLSKPGSHM